MWERLRALLDRHADVPEAGESRVDEIAEQQSAHDRTLARVERLSAEDARIRRAVKLSARGIRHVRRMGG